MANVTKNPYVIDTFGADVNVSLVPTWVTSIIVEGATAADTATFIDTDGDVCFRLSVRANGAAEQWTPSKPFRFDKGLIFDDSASDLAAGDFVQVFFSQ